MNKKNHNFSLLSAKSVGPYIYIIVKGSFLYIGETQRYPFHRWHEHFSEYGTFINKLSRHDPELAEMNCHIHVYWMPLPDIENGCTSANVKRATQYLEHLIHLELYKEPKVFPKYSIISETTRTAPTRSSFPGIEKLASEISSALVINLTTTENCA
jgi:hypothetical protein